MKLNTYGDILNACIACKTKKEAQKVVKALDKKHPKQPEVNRSNIGYLLGYLSERKRKRLQPLFEDCIHPVYGSQY